MYYGFPARNSQVIMVTGTNGKTTTAAYIISVLQAAGHTVGASTTAFYQIGDKTIPNDQNMTVVNVFKLQKALAQMKRAGCEYIVLEVTSHSLLQHRVWGIPCDVAVMTNLTQDHLDYHKTMENYAAAKAKLFERSPRFTVLNRDDEWFKYFNTFPAKERKVTYGTHADADYRIVDVKLHRESSEAKLRFARETDVSFTTHLPGKFNVYNLAAAVAACAVLQVEPEHLINGIANLQTVPGRLERVSTGRSFEVFIDYAHTPDALQNLLETLRHLTHEKLILVFGATGDRDKTKRPIMGGIAAQYADYIVLTDEESYSEDPASIRAEVRKGIEEANESDKMEEIADRREAIQRAIKKARKGDIVVITGMGHEQFRIMGDKRVPWNDAEVAREILQK
jgi:UDP-N-acetylmuramyl-tripeptide synthetase